MYDATAGHVYGRAHAITPHTSTDTTAAGAVGCVPSLTARARAISCEAVDWVFFRSSFPRSSGDINVCITDEACARVCNDPDRLLHACSCTHGWSQHVCSVHAYTNTSPCIQMTRCDTDGRRMVQYNETTQCPPGSSRCIVGAAPTIACETFRLRQQSGNMHTHCHYEMHYPFR